MEELVARIATAAEISPEQSQRAIGIILAFLRREGPTEKVNALLQQIPGGEEAANAGDADKPSGGGLMGGLMGMLSGGGGLMGLAAQLSALGLGTTEMQKAGQELFTFAREKAGPDEIDEIAGAIPGLRQLM